MTLALRYRRRDHSAQTLVLSVAAGTLAVAGAVAATKFGRKLAASSGSTVLTGTATNVELQWNISSNQTITITQGTSVDMTTFLTNTTGQAPVIAYYAGPGLPVGVSLSSAGILNAEINAAVGDVGGHQLSATTSGPEYLQFVDRKPVGFQSLRNDTPTDLHASPSLWIEWNNRGGDWRDANDVSQGSTPYASTPQPSSFGVMSWNVAALVTRLLGRNTGFFLHKPGGGAGCYFESRESTSSNPKPTLQVVTNAGTFNPPLIADVAIENTTTDVGDSNYVRTPGLVKFDLSDVTGNVASATLSLYARASLSPGQAVLVDYLDAPRLFYDPANEIGGTVPGFAATLSQDRDLYTDSRVIDYTDFTSTAVMDAEFDILSGNHTGFVSWPEYGLTAWRVYGDAPPAGSTPSIANMSKFPVEPSSYPADGVANQGCPTEIYFRYGLLIESDVYINHHEHGTKLPGLQGAYEFGSRGASGVNSSNNWSARTEHSGKCSGNPHFYRFAAAYWYGGDHPLSQFSGVGLLRWSNLYNICLKANRKYWIEQRIKLNTPNGVGGWNSDGILQLWIDDVLIHSETNIPIRLTDLARFSEAPFGNFFHGGGSASLGPIHYQTAGWCTSTQRIGRPKVIA